MWGVRDVGCGLFAEMWDVNLNNVVKNRTGYVIQRLLLRKNNFFIKKSIFLLVP